MKRKVEPHVTHLKFGGRIAPTDSPDSLKSLRRKGRKSKKGD